MAFCNNCGANVPEGTKFCNNCGAPIGSAYSTNRTTGNTTAYAYGGYRANIQKRDIAVAVILSIVTCGIYGLVWFIRIVDDLNTAAQTPEDTSAGMIILLTLVTCGIYGYIWLYKAGDKVDKIRTMNGEAAQNSSLVYLLLCIFGLSIVTYCLIQTELNKVAALA